MVNRIPAGVLASCTIALVACGVVAGCSSGGGQPSQSPSVPVSTSAPAATSAPAGSTVAAGCGNAPWHSGSVTVTHHVNVPPVPVVTAVRVAQHPECGYDRIVLDVRGPVPGYSVRYVQRVIADASGQVITMPGARYLVITLRPAQAHNEAGSSTVTGGVHNPAYPALASWALAGDFEGVVRIALGLAGPTSIRTGEIAGRIYLDVKE